MPTVAAGPTLKAVRRTVKSRRVVLSAQDRVHFTRQLSLLMEAGVPLVEGLHAIAEQEPRAGLQARYQDVTARISSGDSVGAALEAHRASFGGVYVDTVRAAESVGSLGTVLESLAEMLERDDELWRKKPSRFSSGETTRQQMARVGRSATPSRPPSRVRNRHPRSCRTEAAQKGWSRCPARDWSSKASTRFPLPMPPRPETQEQRHRDTRGGPLLRLRRGGDKTWPRPCGASFR